MQIKTGVSPGMKLGILVLLSASVILTTVFVFPDYVKFLAFGALILVLAGMFYVTADMSEPFDSLRPIMLVYLLSFVYFVYSIELQRVDMQTEPLGLLESIKLLMTSDFIVGLISYAVLSALIIVWSLIFRREYFLEYTIHAIVTIVIVPAYPILLNVLDKLCGFISEGFLSDMMSGFGPIENVIALFIYLIYAFWIVVVPAIFSLLSFLGFPIFLYKCFEFVGYTMRFEKKMNWMILSHIVIFILVTITHYMY